MVQVKISHALGLEAVDVGIHWLYTGRVDVVMGLIADNLGKPSDERKLGCYCPFRGFIRLYTL